MKKLLLLSSAVALMAMTSISNAMTHGRMRLMADTLKTDTTAVDTTKKDIATTDSVKKEEKKGEYYDLIKKDSTFRKGLFTVRKIEDKYYFEVPDSILGRYLLAVTRYTSVPQGFGKFAGEQVNENTLYFEKRDKKTMLLRAYVLSHLADQKDNIAKTLTASTTDPIVASFKIVQDHPDSLVSMVEVTSLFKNENQLVGMGRATGQMKLGGLMQDRTFIDTMKVFPINIEIGSTRTYGSSGQGTAASYTGSVTLGLNTSLLLLPKEPMRKRLWDHRVGYFVQNFTFFSDDQRKARRESTIARYRLVPKDKAAYKRGELVEPEKPIIYYIDPATPKKWVPYLIQGVNDWNAAFEAAGFKNAIQGREWPADRPDMSVDDARYSVIRYLPAEIENAYGPHVSDPRSGEIMESHIGWYHNIMQLLTKWYFIQCSPSDKRAQTMNFDDKLMGELIRFVSSHEVGHSLGLRHNMGASSLTPVEKLRDKAWVEKHGHTVSIMDYARFNYVAQPEDGISEKGLFPRINDYDKWAIKWGYQYRPEFKDEYEEKEALMKEVTKTLEKNPRLWFSGEGHDEDPRSQTEDLGDNAMKAGDYGIKNLKRIMENIEKWTYQSDDRYDDLATMYYEVRLQFDRYINHVQKNIAGRYLNNLPGKAPIEIPSAELRAEAVDWFARNVFEPPMWLFPQSVTEKTGIDPIDKMSQMQDITLGHCMFTNIINNVYKQSYAKKGAYTIDAYLNDLFRNVWKPVKGNSTADHMRRMLQEKYLGYADKLINQSPSEVSLYVYKQLDRIEDFCRQNAIEEGINGMHYANLLNKITIIRNKKMDLQNVRTTN